MTHRLSDYYPTTTDAVKKQYNMRFEEGNIYHVYSRGNNQQKLFLENDNYLFFLRKIKDHLCPLVDVLACCLMPNHFHLLVYVPEDIEKPALDDQSSDDSESADDYVQEDVSTQIVNAIAVILRSYTRAINKRFKRSGSLFSRKQRQKTLLIARKKHLLSASAIFIKTL